MLWTCTHAHVHRSRHRELAGRLRGLPGATAYTLCPFWFAGRAYLASSQLRKVCPSSTRPLSRVWACSAWHSPSQCRSTEHPQPFHRRGRSRHALRASQPDAEQSTSYAEQASNELSLTGQAKGRSENSAHSSNGAHTSHAAQQGVAQQPADRAEPAASAISPYTPADIPSSRNGLKQQAQQQDAPARSEIPSQLARVAEQGPAASSNGMGYVGDQMQLGSHDAQIAQQLGSEPGIEASPLPEPKVKIRVAHPTSIKTSREKHWALLKVRLRGAHLTSHDLCTSHSCPVIGCTMHTRLEYT